MPKKNNNLRVLKNEGTSEIFFSLVGKTGEATPSELVEHTGMKYPHVNEQLNRLKRINIVKLSKKEGRYRIYKINWKALANIAIKRFEQDSDIKHLNECPMMTKKDYLLKVKKLKNNKNFENFFKDFVEETVRAEFSPDTVDELIDMFETDLKKNYEKIPSTGIGKILKEWGKEIHEHDQKTTKGFIKAIEKNKDKW